MKTYLSQRNGHTQLWRTPIRRLLTKGILYYRHLVVQVFRFRMHLRIVLLTFMKFVLSVPRKNSLEATICDCSNVKGVALLDTNTPSDCDNHRTVVYDYS